MKKGMDLLSIHDLSADDVARQTSNLAAEFGATYHYMQTVRLISGGVICEIKP